MEKILIVDDDAYIRRAFRRNLEGDDMQVLEADCGEKIIPIIAREQPSLVVMDIRMEDSNGLDALRKLRTLNAKIPVIMMTAYGTTQTAIEAMKLGAYDYILKPLDVPKLKELVANALKAARDMRQVVSYQPLLSTEDYAEGVVGKSEPMQKVFKLIGKVSQSDATVFITGESGTGKELVARSIYHHGLRADYPFLAINCAAIPEMLLESELFGHEKGAFTGANERRIGKFEQCNKGTIFLDEIGDMPLSTQTKILRVLQDGDFQRVGGNETLHVDVRVIAATNRAPETLVLEKKFREDLFYRLNVVRIQIPTLRDRIEDIPILVDYFLQKLQHTKLSANRKLQISPEATSILKKYLWPGNVRELRNVIERATVVTLGDSILPSDLPQEVRELRPPSVPAQDISSIVKSSVQTLYELARRDPKLKVMSAVERELITRALDETSGNQVQAAKLLGITRATLRKRIERFKISRRVEVR